MHVSFLTFCFSAARFFINVSFRAVASAFETFCPVDTVLLFTVFTVLMNEIFIRSFINSKMVWGMLPVRIRWKFD